MLKVITNTLLNNDVRSIELEFRIGLQTKTGFHAQIPKIVWSKSKENFGDAVESIIIDHYIKNTHPTRYVYTSSKSYWEHKKKVHSETASFGEFAIRSSLALEIKEDGDAPEKFILQRKKRRTSFFRGPWRIDFTRVETIPNTSDVEETYEIEVELHDLGYLFEKEIHLVLEEGMKLARSVISI